MKGWLLGSCLAASMTSGVEAADWQFTAHAADGVPPACEVRVEGDVLDEAGADVQVSCSDANAIMGTLQLVLPGRAFQQRRVALTAEFSSDSTLAPSLSLKTSAAKQTLMFEDDTEQMLLSANSEAWVTRSLVLPVDVDTSQLRIAVLLQGRGAVSLRNVRLTASRPGPIANAVASYLEDVLAALKVQTQGRRDIQWNVLEPEMRVLASGAQTTADVYPAIRFALARIGDKRNMLLTPQVVRALNVGTDELQGATRRLVLSDGAQLLLSALPPVRTAQNVVTPNGQALQ